MRQKLYSMLCLTAVVFAVGITNAQGTYQLPNGSFESWSSNGEPAHWNSFATSDGSLSGLASTPHHYNRSGGRPGSTGSHYLTIYTRSVIGIKANGNMTTGRIHAGSMSASNENNYNYTQRSQTDFSQPISGTPDSMYLWVSFYANNAESRAQVSAIVHGDCDFRSPNDENSADLYCGKAITQFARTTSSASSMQWQQLKVPFVYDGNSSAHYLLLNLTTNAIPGEGHANDSLSVDDIEFVYSAWLTGISVGGNAISSFEQGRFDYTIHLDDTAAFDTISIVATSQAADATIDIQRTRIDDTTAQALITVTAEDGVTIKQYSLMMTSSLEINTDPLGIEVTRLSSLHCYPNPTRGVLTVESESGIISVVDMMGREVLSEPTTGRITIDLTPHPAGCYLLQISDKTTHTPLSRMKIVVEEH